MSNTQTYVHPADNEEIEVLCSDHGIDHGAFLVYCDNNHITSDFESEVSNFIDAYQGQYDNFLEFATQIFDDTQEVPDHLRFYIDYEAWARDLSHDYWETNGYVFFSY